MSYQSPRTSRGRRPSRSPEEIRSATVDAGIEILLEAGLPIGLEAVKFEDAIAASGVPRASAYRAWSGATADAGGGGGEGEGPQVRFRDAVGLRLLASAERTEVTEATVAAIGPLLDRTGESTFAELAPDQRGALLQEIIRVGGNANADAVAADPMSRIQIGLSSVVRMHSAAGADDPLTRALEAAGDVIVQRYLPLYEELLVIFGLRTRAGVTVEQFAYSAAALAEGLWMRPGYVAAISPDRADGTGWSLYSRGLLGLARAYFENDPAAGPETSL